MSVYVYRREPSQGARELAEAIEGVRYRGLRMPIQQKVRGGDVVICWGERLDPINGVQVLNGAALTNKYQDAQRLRAAGVSTIEVSQTRPVVTAEVDPALELYTQVREAAGELYDTTFARTAVFNQGVNQLYTQLSTLRARLQTPAPAARQSGEWVGRMNNHVGGADLLAPPARPDFWVKRENITEEIRIHSFLGKSIRAGKKAPREDVPAASRHAWVRSFDGGWRIVYDGFKSKEAQRELAHRAVAALGLQFGAVDIGIKADRSLIVLEVNRAAGLEGGTIEAYASAIEGWLSNSGGAR